MTRKFGYVRVTSTDQNLDRQYEALLPYVGDKDKIFSEKDLVIMAEQIKNLNPKHLIGLVKLIRAQYDQKNDDRYYEFDLNDLDMNTLNKINFYIKTVNK